MADVETQPETEIEAQPRPVGTIYAAMVAVAAELSRIGVSKDSKNEQQGFRFRGIDQVTNAVSVVLPKHSIVFLPTYHDYPDVERVTAKGAALIYSKVKGVFTFVSAKDGSFVSVTTFGVAMDSGDKAMNKSMSASLKYALLQTFLIPTESTEDADASTPEPSVVKPPIGFDDWFADFLVAAHDGLKPAAAAWKRNREEFREYAKKYHALELEEARALAKKVTASEKAATTAP